MIKQFIYDSQKPGATEKMACAYLKIFNHSENKKYLTYTGLPIQKRQIKSWLKTHVEDGIEYYTWLNTAGEIKGIGLTSSNPVQGCEILGLGVAKDAQNKNIGLKLIKRICDDAHAKGYKTINVKVFADNKRMLRLVIGQDFIPAKIKHRVRYDGCDLVILNKYFS